ncbi:MAG: peptidoglycan editing factor PgeF [Bacillota bacterium]
MHKVTKKGITYFYYPPWEKSGQVRHGFSSRLGGISEGPFAELNLGYKGGDKPAAVSENRRRFLDLWGKEERDLVHGEQVHGTNIALVGAKRTAAVIPETDGLITADPGTVIGAFSADCLLTYLWDAEVPAIGLVHAGWRGTLGGILFQAVEAMRERLTARPGRLQALLAPSIGPCCYEVGSDVIGVARSSAWRDQVVFYPSIRKDHAFLDLRSTNRNILLAAGLQAGSINMSTLCTRCNSRLFYSYRQSGGKVTGSQMGLFFLMAR